MTEHDPSLYEFLFGQENVYKILSGLLGITGMYIAYLTYRRGNEIRQLNDEIAHLKKVNLRINGKFDPETDRQLITNAKKSVQYLGINGLGVFYHCREELISFLRDRNGYLQILLLDPTRESFRKREVFEGDIVGRIKSEWNTSIRILVEIAQMASGKGTIELKLYDRPPNRTLVIVDAIDEPDNTSSMLINYYPEESHTRGYEAGQFLAEFSLVRDRDSFDMNFDYFSKLWNDNKLTSLSDIAKI